MWQAFKSGVKAFYIKVSGNVTKIGHLYIKLNRPFILLPECNNTRYSKKLKFIPPKRLAFYKSPSGGSNSSQKNKGVLAAKSPCRRSLCLLVRTCE